jgi:hypothetical protein
MREDDPRHGSENGYSAGCRQFCCRLAHTQYNAERKRIRKANGIPEHVHGTPNGYVNFDCRCGPCKDCGSKAKA